MYLCFPEYISQGNLNRLTPVSIALYPEYHGIKGILFRKISGKDTDSPHKAQVSAQASVCWEGACSVAQVAAWCLSSFTCL